MYQAIIYYDTEETFYQADGDSRHGTSWEETLTAKTPEELRELVLAHTYTSPEDLSQETINDYPDATEYFTSYLTDVDNNGEASPAQQAEWETGKLRLWRVDCHILVSQITKSKATL